MTHDEKLQAALRAVDAVAGDVSVGPSTTRESLKEIRDAIDMRLDALAGD